MCQEVRRLENKIRVFEDMLLRTKNMYDVDKIYAELTKMRKQIQKMKFQRLES